MTQSTLMGQLWLYVLKNDLIQKWLKLNEVSVNI